jgi:hypothetical protein
MIFWKKVSKISKSKFQNLSFKIKKIIKFEIEIEIKN